MATPQPLYDPGRANPAFHLRYSWTAWPTQGSQLPTLPDDVWSELSPLWEGDGLRALEHTETPSEIQIVFSARPAVSPASLAARAKGRLDHALRTRKTPVDFSRKIALRSIGKNTREDVETYIERQVEREHFVDGRFASRLEELAWSDPKVDLSRPTESARGRYWFNLHIVLVVDRRGRFSRQDDLKLLRDRSLAIADAKGFQVSRLSVMPDHLHVALRGAIDHSPCDVVYAFQNNLAYAFGQKRIWNDKYYVGTFSEYTMGAVRKRVAAM